MVNRTLRMAFLVLCTLAFLRPCLGQIAVTVSFGPPALPVYELPPCPGDGYLWTPGYWAWDPDNGYYWVPGTWVVAPEPGFLWTPGWWGWETGGFLFHEGFWATEVGFYGGINYGFGYFGHGFYGGRWDGGRFRYNTAVLNVNTTIIHNTYIDRTVIVNNTTVNRVSYNGGEGGIVDRPHPEEERVAQERHIAPVAEQQQHRETARSNPDMRASRNQGKPAIAATSRPGEFSGRGVVEAKEAGAPYHAPPNAPGREEARPGGEPANATHAKELQPHQVAPTDTGNSKEDEKNLKEQQKLIDKQNQEHQKLQEKQDKEDQQAQQKQYSQQKQQQMEQKHQQQTQQLEQRHSQETQQMRTRQAPSPRPR